MPQRIQRKRTKGWRMPPGGIYVGRPTIWGNRFTILHSPKQGYLIYDDRPESSRGGYIEQHDTLTKARKSAVRLYRKAMFRQIDLTELRGHDLACWCPLDEPCHADVLLELANRGINT